MQTRLIERMDSVINRLSTLALLLALTASIGCVSDSYRYGTGQSLNSLQPQAKVTPNLVSHGVPNAKVDRIESAVQAPRKLIQKIFRRPIPDPAAESAQREQALATAEEYLSVNGLDDVYIDVRVYQPREQWQRLKANQQIRPIWKYSGGTLNWLRYTILPMRAFGSDRYDPYTNTLNLNSTSSIEAVYESAQAKEYLKNHRFGVGTYAMMQYVPFVPLFHHANTSSDVLTYSQIHLDGKLTEELYPLAYSRIGSTAVSEALSVVTLSPNAPIFTGPLLRVAGGTAGRTAGATIARQNPSAKEEKKVDNPPDETQSNELINEPTQDRVE